MFTALFALAIAIGVLNHYNRDTKEVKERKEREIDRNA